MLALIWIPQFSAGFSLVDIGWDVLLCVETTTRIVLLLVMIHQRRRVQFVTYAVMSLGLWALFLRELSLDLHGDSWGQPWLRWNGSKPKNNENSSKWWVSLENNQIWHYDSSTLLTSICQICTLGKLSFEEFQIIVT